MKEAAIGIFFSESQQEVLLIKRRDTPVWVLPGGGIEPGESPEAAAIREFFEETGALVLIKRCVGIWLPINRLAAKTYVFECLLLENEKASFHPQDESLEVRLWPVDALPPLLFFLHKSWIEEALKNLSSTGTYTMDELTYGRCLKLIVQHPILCLRYFLSRFGFPINT
jgi:8-oxo-dGTP diphosphatase